MSIKSIDDDIEKKDVLEHVNLLFKCVDRAIIELENEHFENFSRQMIFVFRSLC
jgi:hypothetical protein